MTQPTYGPHNAHPLSQVRTELVWEGKYDEYGQRREVDIDGCAMPMQRIEGIDEPRLEAAANQQLTLSNEDDLVAHFFCGSGTTGAVAEHLGRMWIMADLGRFAIHTSRKRLIELQRTLHKEGKPYRAFDVYNLGRYESQWWQQERLQGADTEHRRVILEFFRAEVPTKENDVAYQYPQPGKYIACVKVVDTFGCDTSITVEVEV